MFLPLFKFAQSDQNLIIKIRTPQAVLDNIVVSIEKDEFSFTCYPYYLKVKLPGKINQNPTKPRIEYGSIVFTYPKKHEEWFKNLDDPIDKFIIPVSDSKEDHGEIPFHWENHLWTFMETEFDRNMGYGFGFCYRTNLLQLDIFPLFFINPVTTPHAKRRSFRLKSEEMLFNSQQCLTDYQNNETINEVIVKRTPYRTASRESLQLLDNLPKTEMALCKNSLNLSHNGLIEILFAYNFHQREALFSGTCPLNCNVNVLAATLCWHEGFDTPREAIISVFRRALIFPLYKHFNLCKAAFSDLKALLKMRRWHIQKALLDIYNTFMMDERYILNMLFIKPYLVYVQKWRETEWRAVVDEVVQMKISKQDLDLPLP